MSDELRAILASARANAVIGTGVLTVDGHEVAILHNVDYTGVMKTYEHVLGANGGRVEARFATEMDATLKAGYADVLGHVELFTLNATSAPGSGPLPTHTATYAGSNGITITFPKCNIIPSGLKCVQGDWVSGTIEIKAVGRTLPTISDTPGTWSGSTVGTGVGGTTSAPMTTLGDMVYGTTGGVPTRLAGDTSGAPVFLTAQAVDGEAQPPAWHALEVSDIPTLPYTKVDGFDARVRTSRLDQMALPAGDVGMNSFRLTSLADGAAPGDAVNRAQLDAVTLAVLGGVPTTRTVAGHALSGDVALTTADVPDSTGRRYVTDAQKASLASLSGTNTGDETAARIGALIGGAGEKTTPVDADAIGVVDSAASGLLKRLTWSNLEAALASYFDGLYTLANLGGVPTTRQVAGHALSSDVTLSASDVGLGSVTNDAQVKRTEMGAAGGVATLDSGGTLATGQVPSDVTRQGNTFNGASQLVQLTSAGKLPALDGSLLTGISGGSGGGMSNPMTTAGDLVVGGVDGAPGRLGIGSTGQVLTVVSGAPAWAAASGGGGGGSFDPDVHMPWQVEVDCVQPKAVGGSWDFWFGTDAGSGTDPLAYNSIYYNKNSAAQNDWIEFDVTLAAGTWTIALFHYCEHNQAIRSIYIDGTLVGSIDGYANPGDHDRRDSITGVTVSTTGRHTLKVVAATRNDNCDGWLIGIQHITLRRTA